MFSQKNEQRVRHRAQVLRADKLFVTALREHLEIMDNVFYDALTGEEGMRLRETNAVAGSIVVSTRTRTFAAVGVFAKLGWCYSSSGFALSTTMQIFLAQMLVFRRVLLSKSAQNKKYL